MGLNKMNELKKLNNNVRRIYNSLFPWPISNKEQNVSKAIIAGFGRLYTETNNTVTSGKCYCLHKIKKIKSERKKIRICKRLLNGKGIRIPKLKSDFRIRDIYNDFIPGRKIILNLKDGK